MSTTVEHLAVRELSLSDVYLEPEATGETPTSVESAMRRWNDRLAYTLRSGTTAGGTAQSQLDRLFRRISSALHIQLPAVR